MMSRRSFACLAVTALAVAVLLLVVDSASAQMRRGFYGGYTNNPTIGYGNQYYGGYSPWTTSGFGYGNEYFGGSSPWASSGYRYGNQYYGGYNPWQYSSGWTNYPGSYADYWNIPGYQGFGTEYSSMAPSYYGEGTTGDYYSGTMGGYASTGAGFGSYGALSGGMNNNVLITVRVPPNAEIWVDDQKTTQTGPIRSFISPPLNSDHNFVYHIRARWTENGQQVEKDRRLDVAAGDRLFVNFFPPRSEGTTGANSGQQGNAYQAPSTDRALERSDQTLENQNRSRTENPDRATERTNTAPRPANQSPATQPPATQPPSGTNRGSTTPPG